MQQCDRRKETEVEERDRGQLIEAAWNNRSGKPVPGNKAAVAIGAICGALVLAAGARLAYTETALADMEDYDRRAQAAIDSPTLKAEWAQKLEHLEAKKQEKLAAWGSCDEVSNDPVTKEELPPGVAHLPQTGCYIRRGRFEQDLNERYGQAKEDMGSYEQWALERSGVNKQHRWFSYPEELTNRLRNGERGLLLGPFWKYVL